MRAFCGGNIFHALKNLFGLFLYEEEWEGDAHRYMQGMDVPRVASRATLG